MEQLRYFLGANSPRGFYGYFQETYGPNWHVRLIKGGPGTGKSTLMRRVAEQAGGQWEHIHCSSDPKSLDAIVNVQHRLMIADATAPHTMDPRWPGCVERIVDLGQGFDIQALQQERAAIVDAAARNGALHRQAVQYLAAAAAVRSARLLQGAIALRTDKVREQTAQLCRRDFPALSGRGTVRRRGLCALTPDGVLTFESTVAAQADTVYLVRDDWGAAAPLFLQEMADRLQAMGYDIVACRCSLAPEDGPEHLILPAQRVAIVTANAAHPFAGISGLSVDLRDSYGPQRPGTLQSLQRLLTQQQTMQDAAVGCMYQARLVHDELEQYYIRAMDFVHVENVTRSLISEMQSLMQA